MIFFQLLHKMHFLFTIGKKYETTVPKSRMPSGFRDRRGILCVLKGSKVDSETQEDRILLSSCVPKFPM